jgi:hypothetical protein
MSGRVLVGGLFIATCLSAAAHAAINAQVVATKAQVEAFCGTSNVKLVFVARSNLYTVDFSGPEPVFTEIGMNDSIIEPSISPDGQWILYAKGPAYDMSGYWHSAAYLIRFGLSPGVPQQVKANNAYVPRFVPNAPEMTVLYCDTNGLYHYDMGGQTRKMACPDGVPSGVEETVWDSGCAVGGISWDNTHLASAFPDAIIADLRVTTRPGLINYHHLAGPSTFWHWMQASNPSITTSRRVNNVMMCVDFGVGASDTLNTLGYYVNGVNDNHMWRMHEVIFIKRADSTIVHSYTQPGPRDLLNIQDTCTTTAGITHTIVRETAWDDPEWSNHPYFAAANLMVRRRWCTGQPVPDRERHEMIYLINLVDSTYLPLVRSTDVSETAETNLQWPYVWVEVPGDFAESNWLDVTYPPPPPPNTTGQALPHSRTIGMAISKAGEWLTCTAPMSSATVLTLQGAVVRDIRLPTVATTARLGALPPGLYLVDVTGANGQRAQMRWSVTR